MKQKVVFLVIFFLIFLFISAGASLLYIEIPSDISIEDALSMRTDVVKRISIFCDSIVKEFAKTYEKPDELDVVCSDSRKLDT